MTDAYVPLTGPPTWHHAACRGEDPDLWFPLQTEPPTVNRHGETAVDICRRCPHTADCVAFAIKTNSHHGIWGGLTLEERGPVPTRKHRRSELERWRRQQISTGDVRRSLSPSGANAKTDPERRPDRDRTR